MTNDEHQRERDADNAKLRAELAAAQAACAAKDAALRVLGAEDNSVLDGVVIAAALALDAGKGWVDASGAVETTVARFPAFDAAKIMAQTEVPADWAGKPVLIMLRPDGWKP